ncbi:MAG: methionine--tRNA ligase [Saprospiraceae bacterium]|nr:methionine--tRNA ligase [Saprospiraceae bacterium]
MGPVRHLVTAALPYANGPLHIGHLAGAYLPADVYVRFMRLMDKDIVFICGSDEHGAAITMRAVKEGIGPQEIIDKYHKLFESTFKGIGISFDYYGRTSDKIHHESSQEFFRVLHQKGVFEEKESEQYFDEKLQQFLADRYITGTCPKCNYDSAYGDQCEQCGSSLNPTDLIHPKSVLSGETPVFKKTTHWYLPLEKDELWLREFIEDGKLDEREHHDPSKWKTHVTGQCRSWLENGLQSRAMTRDLDWGVDVPQEIAGSKGKKLYVWMDAPIGYISATKQWAQDHQKNWKDYWMNPDTELIHFIGKDNIVFHCIIFPALLKAHGDFILPSNVPANQFMNLEDQKISTSRNWAIWVHEYLTDLAGHEDALRYYLIKNMPEQKDSEFTWKGFQDAYNNELVNNLSNFVHRVLVLTHKYYDGFVSDFDQDAIFTGVAPDDMGGFHDTECLYLFDKLDELNQYHRDFDFRAALKCLMEISSQGNQLLQLNEPWKNQKEDPEMVEVVMNLALHYVTALSVAMHPFLPFASNKLRHILNLPDIQSGDLLQMMDRLAEGERLLPTGHKLNAAEYLFTKIDDATIQKQIDKLHQPNMDQSDQPPNNFVPQKNEITYDEFMKMDIRTARILEAEAIPKADKLLKLQLDLGYEKRMVVSGIAEHFKPEEILGKEVLILANLAPRTIRGIESRGMILMAEKEDGKLSFVSPEKNWPCGYTVK